MKINCLLSLITDHIDFPYRHLKTALQPGIIAGTIKGTIAGNILLTFDLYQRLIISLQSLLTCISIQVLFSHADFLWDVRSVIFTPKRNISNNYHGTIRDKVNVLLKPASHIKTVTIGIFLLNNTWLDRNCNVLKSNTI